MRVSGRFSLALLTAMAVFGAFSHALLLAHGKVPDWLLPAAFGASALLLVRRKEASSGRPEAEGEPAPRWLAWVALLLLSAAFLALAYGALATPSRHWDGAVTWDVKAYWLARDPTIEQPYFRDGTVYVHSRDYPLLQPLCIAMGERLCGGGRLFFPLLFALFCSLLSHGLSRVCSGALRLVLLAGAALTPILVNPTSGGFDSGYGDALLLVAVTSMAVGFASKDGRFSFLGALLAVLAKPEGLAYGGAAVAAAFCAGPSRLLLASAGGFFGGALLWLPLQKDLMSLGRESGMGVAAPVLAALFAAVTSLDHLAERPWFGRRGRTLWALILLPLLLLALPALVLALGNENGTVAFYFGDLARPWRRLDRLPAIAWGLLHYGLLRGGFGLMFWLAAAAFWLALRRRALPEPKGLPLFLSAGLAMLLFPFLLSGEQDLAHHLRSSAPRLELHWIGCAALFAGCSIADARAPLSDLGRKIAPPGSRRSRFLWMAWLVIRKMRDGPIPWWRAVRIGIWQVLPARLRERRLERIRAGWQAAPRLPCSQGVEVRGRVSVVLPVYEQAALLDLAIRSVLEQDWPDLELIVLDDGSGPRVGETIARHASDPRVRWLRQPRNLGLPRALDAAFEVATGEYWCWTSADNLMDRRCIATLVADLREHPDVGMVFADYELIDAEGRPVTGGEFRVHQRRAPGSAIVDADRDPRQLSAVQDNFVGGCFLYRGSAGRLLGRHDPRMGLEDYDYWLRMQRHYGIRHVETPEVLYRYRVHSDSLTARARDLRLWERGAHLLKVERRRAEWDRLALTWVLPSTDREWMEPMRREGDSVSLFPARAEKGILLLDARSHGPIVCPDPCAVFLREPSHAYRYAAVLRQRHCLAFAADSEVAARAAIFTRQVVEGVPGPEAGKICRRFASERSWQARHRDPDDFPAPECPGIEGLSVLFQCDRFTQGGLERVVLDLAAGLRALGARAGLLVLGPSGEALGEAASLGIEIVEPEPARRDYAAFLERGAWNIVHAHDSVLGARDAALAGVPFAQTIHNTYVWFPPERIEEYREADRSSTAYVAVGTRALEYADLRLGLDAGKALVIPNGISRAPAVLPPQERAARRAEFGFAERDFVFVEVASIAPVKGQRAAVAALKRLRDRGIDARLLLVGGSADDWYGAALERDLDRLGLRGAVVMAGFLPDPGVAYGVADAFVLPSVYEGYSLAVCEALSAGLPVVATDAGDAANQIRDRGIVVDPPFASLAELDWTTVGRFVGAVPEDFVARLADSMAEIARKEWPRRSAALPWRFAARRALEAHARLFAWLKSGGSAASARAWLRRHEDAGPSAPEAGA
ncbi:MAG: hypothetical protein Fur0037_00710 [Planctomycetota bacterium]